MNLFNILVILFIGIIPCLLYLCILYNFQALTRERLIAARFAISHRDRLPISSQAEQEYIEEVGYIIGDLTCKFNARSSQVRCAVNPLGHCKNCLDYESINF